MMSGMILCFASRAKLRETDRNMNPGAEHMLEFRFLTITLTATEPLAMIVGGVLVITTLSALIVMSRR